MTTRTITRSCPVTALCLLSLVTAGCGTTAPAAPAAPVAPPAAPAPQLVAPALAAPSEPAFVDPNVASSTLVASLVTVAPNKIIGDLDALSRRLELPMMLGQELLSSLGGLGLVGDANKSKEVWERLDAVSPIAVAWVMPAKSRVRGFCAAISFRDAAGARRTFDEMGVPGAERDGVAERRTKEGDVVWGGVKGRTLFVSGSADALLLAGGLAQAAQVPPASGQLAVTLLPQALAAASGKSREAIVARVASALASDSTLNPGKNKDAFKARFEAVAEAGVGLALDSSAVRLVLEVGPKNGLVIQGDLIPIAGTAFAAQVAERSPYVFDTQLPIRDDSTAAMAMAGIPAWLTSFAKILESTGPAGQAAWRDIQKMFEATGEWSCVFDPAEAGFSTLCSSALKPGTTPKAALDAAVALANSQQAWEAELYGQKLSPLKIKRTRDGVAIEKKIEYRDALARSMAIAIAGGDTVKSAFMVKGGRLLQAAGRDAQKTLSRHGANASLKGAPLLAAALARTKGQELFFSADVVSTILRVLGKGGKEMPGKELAAMAGTLPGIADMKVPVVFSLHGGSSLVGDFRIPLGSLDNVAKVVREMLGSAGTGQSP
jgi:hypothetical protein